jgi:hypothetical protein
LAKETTRSREYIEKIIKEEKEMKEKIKKN